MPRDVKERTAPVGEWAESVLVPRMVYTLIEDAGADGFDKIKQAKKAATKDARQIVRAVEAHYKKRIENLAAEYLEDVDAWDELSTFAYYLVMQSRGHGVAWSDDHEGELWTPQWDAAMWFVDKYAPEEVENPRRPRRMIRRPCKKCGKSFTTRESDLFVCDECYDEEAAYCPDVCGDDDAFMERLDWWAHQPSQPKWLKGIENPRGSTRLPSVKTIRERLRWLDKTSMGAAAAARFIRKTMEAADPSRALRAMDNALDTYGVDYIPSHQDSLTDSRYVYGLECLNTGDPYITTVIYDWGTGSWKIEAWGDIVERSPRRFGE